MGKKKRVVKKRTRKHKNKISVKDGGKGFILMMKSELAKFPKIGKHFKVIHGDKYYPIEIKAIPCVRAGHVKKHKHYQLAINFHELKPGDLIEIVKDNEKGYLLAIKEILKKKMINVITKRDSRN